MCEYVAWAIYVETSLYGSPCENTIAMLCHSILHHSLYLSMTAQIIVEFLEFNFLLVDSLTS